MSPEKEAALVKDFPHLFRDRGVASPMQSCFFFGFETGDGWEPLLREAASKLEPLIVKMIDDAIKAKDMEALDYIPAASQIKEKYGTLRFYMTTSTEEMDKITEEAEDKSEITCEECGQTGTLRGDGWYYTACNECHEKRQAKHGK